MPSPGSVFRRTEALGVRWASAERVVLAGVLLVLVPVTTTLFPTAAPAVVPSTLLVAVGYWLLGKALRNDSALLPYAIFGGALAGYMNMSAGMHLHLWLSGQFEALVMAGLSCLIFGFFGCFHGVAYGLALLPPLWLARRARRFHPEEATDRALAGTGLWGLATLGIAAPLSDRFAIQLDLGSSARLDPTSLWVAATIGCSLLFVLGVERLRERRTWLARVRQGRVPGWLVVSSEQLGDDVNQLPLFCAPLLGRERRVSFVLAECGTH
ncbi:MAG TPA: hypothetical protein VFU02_14805, partial [Polyangiaceae bacterium]|nr:hypothetical protein [Polyangiaceae bacterium]